MTDSHLACSIIGIVRAWLVFVDRIMKPDRTLLSWIICKTMSLVDILKSMETNASKCYELHLSFWVIWLTGFLTSFQSKDDNDNPRIAKHSRLFLVPFFSEMLTASVPYVTSLTLRHAILSSVPYQELFGSSQAKVVLVVTTLCSEDLS